MKKYSAIGLCFLTAVGCGGGGGSSTKPETTKPPVVSQNTYSITIQEQDYCGNVTPVSNAKLMVHNSNFTSSQIISANSSGTISYSTTESKKSLSLLIPNYDKTTSEMTQLAVRTFVEHPIKAMGELTLQSGDQSMCGCQTTDIHVDNDTHQVSNHVKVSVNGTAVQAPIVTSTGVIVENYQVCQTQNGEYDLYGVTLEYPELGEFYAAEANAFQPGVRLNASLTPLPLQLNVLTPIDAHLSQVQGVYQYKNAKVAWRTPVGTSIDSIHVYPLANNDFNMAFVSSRDSSIDIPGTVYSHVRKYNAVDFTGTPPSIDLELSDIAQIELTSLATNSAAAYDFSSHADFDYLYVYVDTSNTQTGYTTFWNITAPTSGDLGPLFDGIDFDQIYNEFGISPTFDDAVASFALYGYKNISGYQDYINNHLEERNRAAMDARWDNLTGVSVFAVFQDVNLIPGQPLDVDNYSVTKGEQRAENSPHFVF